VDLYKKQCSLLSTGQQQFHLLRKDEGYGKIHPRIPRGYIDDIASGTTPEYPRMGKIKRKGNVADLYKKENIMSACVTNCIRSGLSINEEI